MGTPISVEVPEAAKREKARERAAALARKGTDPSQRYSPADLAWAFYTDELQAELEELNATAKQVREERTAAWQAKQQAERLSRATEAVLREWDEEEKRERYERARAEAEKRIAAAAEED